MGATLIRRSNTLIPFEYLIPISPVFDRTDRFLKYGAYLADSKENTGSIQSKKVRRDATECNMPITARCYGKATHFHRSTRSHTPILQSWASRIRWSIRAAAITSSPCLHPIPRSPCSRPARWSSLVPAVHELKNNTAPACSPVIESTAGTHRAGAACARFQPRALARCCDLRWETSFPSAAVWPRTGCRT
jgi:hypothetical protein